MDKLENDRSTLIPSGLVAILASTCCFSPFTLLGLGYSGALTERGLVISPDSDAKALAPSARTGPGSDPPSIPSFAAPATSRRYAVEGAGLAGKRG